MLIKHRGFQGENIGWRGAGMGLYTKHEEEHSHYEGIITVNSLTFVSHMITVNGEYVQIFFEVVVKEMLHEFEQRERADNSDGSEEGKNC